MQSITAGDVNRYAGWFWQRFHPFAFHPTFFPNFLAHFPMLNGTMQFDWDYELIPNGTVFGSLNAFHNVTAQIPRLLVETGIAVTPAAQPLNDFRAGFAVVRYADYFRSNQPGIPSPLLINSDPALRSRRFKVCMAEELASGIACYLLREYLDVVHIVDYQVWRSLTNQTLVGRFPDYYCITSSGEGLLVEVKGSITTKRSNMNQPRQTARVQVLNGRFGAEPQRQSGSRFIIASNLLVEGAANRRSISYIEQIIPPAVPLDDAPEVNDPPVVDPSNLSFSKILRYIGLDEPAEQLAKGQALRLDESRMHLIEESVNDLNYRGLGYDPFGNVIFIEADVLNALKAGQKPKALRKEKKRQLRPTDEPNEKVVLTLNDSVIVYPNPVLLGAKLDG